MNNGCPWAEVHLSKTLCLTDVHLLINKKFHTACNRVFFITDRLMLQAVRNARSVIIFCELKVTRGS